MTRIDDSPLGPHYLVRVSAEIADRLIADDSDPAVIIRIEAHGDGTHEMHLRTPERCDCE